VPVADWERKHLQTVALVVIATVMTGFALHWLRAVLVPLLLSVFISFLVVPVVDWFESQLRMPRWAAVATTVVINLVGIASMAALLGMSAVQIGERLDFYQSRVIELGEHLADQVSALGIDLRRTELLEALRTLPVFEWFQAAATGTLGVLGDFVLVSIFTIYLIAARPSHGRLRAPWSNIEKSVRSYFATKIVTSSIVAVITGVIMWLFGLDMTVFFAVATLVLHFIPTVGSILSVILPLPIAVLQLGMGKTALMVSILIVIHQIIGNVAEPKMMRGGLDLHPVTTLAALIVWGMLFGPIGMFLAPPLTVVVKIICERYTLTRSVAAILAGRMGD